MSTKPLAEELRKALAGCICVTGYDARCPVCAPAAIEEALTLTCEHKRLFVFRTGGGDTERCSDCGGFTYGIIQALRQRIGELERERESMRTADSQPVLQSAEDASYCIRCGAQGRYRTIPAPSDRTDASEEKMPNGLGSIT